jgi:hypothetical protein
MLQLAPAAKLMNVPQGLEDAFFTWKSGSLEEMLAFSVPEPLLDSAKVIGLLELGGLACTTGVGNVIELTESTARGAAVPLPLRLTFVDAFGLFPELVFTEPLLVMVPVFCGPKPHEMVQTASGGITPGQLLDAW